MVLRHKLQPREENGLKVGLVADGEVVRRLGVEPERATQKERMEILFELYGMGIYNLKGAVARTVKEV